MTTAEPLSTRQSPGDDIPRHEFLAGPVLPTAVAEDDDARRRRAHAPQGANVLDAREGGGGLEHEQVCRGEQGVLPVLVEEPEQGGEHLEHANRRHELLLVALEKRGERHAKRVIAEAGRRRRHPTGAHPARGLQVARQGLRHRRLHLPHLAPNLPVAAHLGGDVFEPLPLENRPEHLTPASGSLGIGDVELVHVHDLGFALVGHRAEHQDVPGLDLVGLDVVHKRPESNAPVLAKHEEDVRDGDDGEVDDRPELREPGRRERGRGLVLDLFLERGQVRGRRGLRGVGVGGGRRGLDRGGCVGGVGREMLLVRLEVAPGIVLGVAASPVIHDGLAALGARGGFRVERGGIVPFLLVMRESHGVGISRRLDARFQREHVQDQERQMMQAQAVEVEPTLLRGHLGDVGRVSQVKPPHGDDPRDAMRGQFPNARIAFRRGSTGRYPRIDGRSYARAINADERRESSRYAHEMLNGAKVVSFGLLSARRYEILRDSPIGEKPGGVRERLWLKENDLDLYPLASHSTKRCL